MKLAKLSALLGGGMALVLVLLGLVPPDRVRGFDVDGFGRIPVLENGRVKPLDSVARNALLVLRSQQAFRFQGRTVGANEWLMDVMLRPQVADTQPVFVINDPDILGLMGLAQASNRYFSFAILAPHVDEIGRQAQSAASVDPRQRTRFQRAILNLYARLDLYRGLKNSLQLPGTPGLSAELESLSMPESQQHQDDLARRARFRPFWEPQSAQSAQSGRWLNTGEALRAAAQGNEHPALPAMARMAAAYGGGDPDAFHRNLTEFRQRSAQGRTDAEHLLNRVEPFYKGMLIYIVALLVLFVSWIWKREVLQSTAFGLLVAGAMVHTAGLVLRILLQGRPPVTNLYSSAVFMGWGVVVGGIILERWYRRGFGTAVSAAIGAGSLLVAQALASDGDTMEMMRAVLDSNFWLATHVITITMGYSGTFLAGGIAIGHAIRKHVVSSPDPRTTRGLEATVYGVVCFALFFSFVGTVLGGIWADQSWGRFWGWDPKENGALLIVLWNAIILHARSGKLVTERGLMAMAIVGNIITSFSWFGVNMLGVGLHSYGFMDKAFWWLSGFIGLQILMTGLCFLPSRLLTPSRRAATS
jgi:ABC-type transport system involved in cytochrome c biogenesis permease subunit